MHGSSIAPECIQETLESAKNAASKGLSQFFTPMDFGYHLARGLPYHRPVVVDFSCGNGQLLSACINTHTKKLLGGDLDPCNWIPDPKVRNTLNTLSADKCGNNVNTVTHHKTVADMTKLYPVLKEVGFQFDCGAFNPPWDAHMYRERLALLAESECEAVREAFAAHDGRTSHDTIDSTAVTVLMALDMMTDYGEAFLIGNEATLQRLILAPGAPHGALKKHIWAHITLLGNPMTGIQDCSFQKGEQFRTGVIYFARSHEEGIKYEQLDITSMGEIAGVGEHLCSQRDNYNRSWYKIKGAWQCTADFSVERWVGASCEYEMRQRAKRSDWNIWVDDKGIIRVNLSLFDRHNGKIDKKLASELFELQDKRPMQLVLQRQQRRELERAVFDSPWRVQPALQDAVKDAVKAYHSERAPLYPLPKIQRLGYLDENDEIKCCKAFGDLGLFVAGKSYKLDTRTYKVCRHTTKINLSGEPESIALTGSELCFAVTGEDNNAYTFMDGYLKTTTDVEIEGFWNGGEDGKPHFTLQQLVDHFEIPEVPDVATLHQDVYARNKETLSRIFAALNG